MRLSPIEHKLTKIATPIVEERGLRLVCVKVSGADGANTVTIMAEDPITRRLNVDDCARISRELSAVLDVEDPISAAYRLEVSSPGIDRPLITMQDFADFAGFEAKIEMDTPLEGQKRFRGRLKGTDGELVLLETEERGIVSLPFPHMQKAKLILTDDLLNATKKTKTG